MFSLQIQSMQRGEPSLSGAGGEEICVYDVYVSVYDVYVCVCIMCMYA